MKSDSKIELLTVRDVAKLTAIQRSDHGIAKTMRQIRHWTQCDLIQTATKKNTGKGIPRFYNIEPTLEIVSILLELNRYGATVDILKPAADALYDLWDGSGGPYYYSSLTDVNNWMRVSWSEDPETGLFVDADIVFFDEMDDKSEQDLPIDRTSWITIHLNRVIGGMD